MTAIEVHEITSREQWLELRKPYITASVIAACPSFNAHPFVSPLRLFCEKRGVEFHDDPDNKVLRRGRWLEPAVKKACEELHPEWRTVAPNKFYCDPKTGIGATPDLFIEEGDPRGRGNLQIKTVAPNVWKRDWDSGNEIPLHVILQTATEAMLAPDIAFSAVAVMLVDPHNMDVAVLDVPRHAGAEAKIIAEVKRFWIDIRNGIEPDPDFSRDAELLKVIAPHEVAGRSIDLSHDNELPALLAQREEIMAVMKGYEDRKSEIETMLKFKMKDAESVIGLPDWAITWKTTHRQEYVMRAKDIRTLRIHHKGER